MATTSVSDIIVPEVFLPYAVQRSVELSQLVSSGIIQASPEFDAIASEGGTTVDMPFFDDLVGDSEVIVEGVPTVTGKITASSDKAIKLQRRKSWAVHDLAKFLSGADPMAAIGNMVGGWWARDMQKVTLALLAGIFDTAGLADNVHAIHHTSGGAGGATNANRFTGSTFIDAKGLLGDHAGSITALITHSAVEQSLRKQDLIDYIVASDGVTQLATFQGLRLIVDDTMPVATVDGELVYTTFLFGAGALALGMDSRNPVPEGAAPGSTYQLEFARDASQEISKMINRRHFLLHPRGVKWLGASMAAKSPTNAELSDDANWEPVFDPKNIRIVRFTHNLL